MTGLVNRLSNPIQLFSGSQFFGPLGDYQLVPFPSQNLVQAQLAQLKSYSGISFDKEKIRAFDPVPVTDGCCTAMSMEFANKYFYFKERNIDLFHKNPTHFIALFTNSVANLFNKNSTEFMARQAAFNTIRVEDKAHGTDYTRNKIKALVNFHQWDLGYSSEEIDLEKIENEKTFENVIASLPKGVYLCRAILPATNEKMEVYGHSVIYIKDRELELFYDPNYGLFDLSTLSSSSLFLFNQFKNMYMQFQTNKLRFHQITNIPGVIQKAGRTDF